jgi:hypothetical protein
MVGRLGGGRYSHGYHPERVGQALRRDQGPFVTFDPGVRAFQALGCRTRLSHRLERVKRSTRRAGLFQRLQRSAIEETREVENHLVPSDRAFRCQLGGNLSDRVIGSGNQDELGFGGCLRLATLM